MTQITLVLPFALPPPELAPDLARALQAPALSALLTRTASHTVTTFHPGARALPHELWLARALGLPAGENCPFAVAAMRGFGLDTGDGTWFIVNPAHIEIARSHLSMNDPRRLHLSEPHARALFESAKPYFDEIDKPLLYGDANTWFMRADAWAELDTASPDAAAGQNVTDWLPSGAVAAEYRKLQNEVQMLWFEHPANLARAALGQPPVNSFWPWAPASQRDAPAKPGALASINCPPWLTAATGRAATTAPQFAAAPGSAQQATQLVVGSLGEAAIAADWSGWLMQMQRLEQELFAPLLAALGRGAVSRIDLVLTRRDAQATFATTKMSQRAFWRRPTLNRLLP
ncbi:hypothetical protein [Massilia glaciei]|uniref:Phosphoglycerate mutase n=1 Tax=Massilia glaciei TaxID=1524097 RepID=A0A2U2HIP1_9BURK|nr:hypothetical protein [Massilia glaciei]PWF46628.1 hypothetical protein C7C56_016180 [Massilia glaciei]